MLKRRQRVTPLILAPHLIELLTRGSSLRQVGWLRDSFGEVYSVPFMVTLLSSLCEVFALRFLMRKDEESSQHSEQAQVLI